VRATGAKANFIRHLSEQSQSFDWFQTIAFLESF
jgi:hypothetical protein